MRIECGKSGHILKDKLVGMLKVDLSVAYQNIFCFCGLTEVYIHNGSTSWPPYLKSFQIGEESYGSISLHQGRSLR